MARASSPCRGISHCRCPGNSSASATHSVRIIGASSRASRVVHSIPPTTARTRFQLDVACQTCNCGFNIGHLRPCNDLSLSAPRILGFAPRAAWWGQHDVHKVREPVKDYEQRARNVDGHARYPRDIAHLHPQAAEDAASSRQQMSRQPRVSGRRCHRWSYLYIPSCRLRNGDSALSPRPGAVPICRDCGEGTWRRIETGDAKLLKCSQEVRDGIYMLECSAVHPKPTSAKNDLRCHWDL